MQCVPCQNKLARSPLTGKVRVSYPSVELANNKLYREDDYSTNELQDNKRKPPILTENVRRYMLILRSTGEPPPSRSPFKMIRATAKRSMAAEVRHVNDASLSSKFSSLVTVSRPS
jgi:hypothetical protein